MSQVTAWKRPAGGRALKNRSPAPGVTVKGQLPEGNGRTPSTLSSRASRAGRWPVLPDLLRFPPGPRSALGPCWRAPPAIPPGPGPSRLPHAVPRDALATLGDSNARVPRVNGNRDRGYRDGANIFCTNLPSHSIFPRVAIVTRRELPFERRALGGSASSLPLVTAGRRQG